MLRELSSTLLSELKEFNPVAVESKTGSIYVSFTGSKVKQIRVSNHGGHKLKRNVWELRTDAMTSRNGSNRIYNKSAIRSLIRDFK